ncbi:hypothetical protein Pelo_4516 [Pelomyxa schiedti]|nr:hypothetical protein Pelo_4516 [Pelomyxa schiedti]
MSLDCGSSRSHRFFTFTVSPTLGLVDGPSPADFGPNNDFRGWVGPARSLDYGTLARRFAVVSDTLHSPGGYYLSFNHSVIDTDAGNGVVATIRNRMSISDLWDSNRKWGVLVPVKGWDNVQSMTLWNFEGLGGSVGGGGARKVEGMPLPWREQVKSCAFNGTDFLVLMLDARKATWEQQSVVAGCPPTTFLEANTGTMWCWCGMVYTTTWDGSLFCINTGQKTKQHNMFQEVLRPIGGPYFSSKSYASGRATEVYSVLEPMRMCCRVDIGGGSKVACAQELAVKQTGDEGIEVLDAVGGSFVVFKMRIKGSLERVC